VTSETQPRRRDLFPAVSRGIAAVSAAVGGLALAESARLAPAVLQLRPETAAAFLLAGAAVWLAAPGAGPGARWLGRTAGLGVTLIGLTLVVRGVAAQAPPAGPESWLALGARGGLACLLLGLALLALDGPSPPVRSLAPVLAGLAAWVGYFQALTGLYAVSAAAVPQPAVSQSLIGLLHLLLPVALLLARPDRGFVPLLRSSGPGGAVLRWLSPLLLAVPASIGWLRVESERRSWLSLETASAMFVTVSIGLFFLILLAVARHLDAGDRRRRRAEEALRENEERYRRVIEDQTEFIVRWKPDWTRTFVNDAYCRYFGEPRERLIGTSFMPLVAEADHERVRAKIARLTPDNAAETGVHRVVRPDGSLGWQEWTDRGIFDADGRLVELQSVGRDVTDRRNAEEALRNSEERYRLLVERNLAGVYRTTVDGRILACNEAFAGMLGYAGPDEVLRLGAVDLYSNPGSRQELVRALQESREVRNRESVLRRSDGTAIWVLENVSLVGEGGVPVLEGTILDISERKRSEERLLLQSTALESVANAIVVTDETGTILWVNPAFTRLTGYTPVEAIGRSTRILRSGRHDPAFYAEMWRAIGEGSVWRGEVVNRRKDGTLYTEEMTITPVRAEDGRISRFIAVKEDVTERRQLEDQLRQAQKMEAVGRLAGGVAHDFNNLLGVILGYAGMLLRRTDPGDPAHHKLEQIQTAAERGAALTRQLLAYGRKQTLDVKVLDLNGVVANLASMLERILGEDVTLRAVPGRELGRVRADLGQIEQVLVNLAVNARDAMPDGGTLTIETANAELDHEYARRHPPARAGAYVALSVSDQGLGMDAETRTRIFEPFFTTKERGKGTGLGLATVYGIVKQSEGYIWVYSEPGLGTTFKIYLPRVERPADELPPPSPAVEHRGSETLLVVEDDPSLREMTCEVLESTGYRVLSADCAVAGLAVSDRHPGTIDLLITDIVMPGANGRELAERLAQRRPGLRVLFVSGYTEDTIAHHGVLDPDRPLLSKPFTAEALTRKVRELLDRPPPAPLAPPARDAAG
jgi:PAS domain S-box-containing protein